MNKIDLARFSKLIDVITPIVNKKGVYKGRHLKVNLTDGWYKIRLGDKIKVLEKADEIEVDDMLNQLPSVRGYTLGASIIPLNFDSIKFKYGYTETIPVQFIRSELWDVVVTRRHEDSCLYYQDLDYAFDNSVVLQVKERFETEKSLEGIKGLNPELRYLYLILCLQRDNYRALIELEKLKISEAEKKKRLEEFNQTLAGRLLKAITDADCKLIRFHRQGNDKLVVIWSSGGQRINSLIDLNLRVIEGGFCLSGQDKFHSIQSLALLSKMFEKEEGSLYLTRE